jgi:hypothetical protein
MPCEASDQNVSVECNPPNSLASEQNSVDITLFELSSCPGATIVIIDCPLRGVLVDNNDGTATYTPSSNFEGNDNFSYTLSGTGGDPGTGIVTISVTGQKCEYYEAVRCDGQLSNPRLWVHKSYANRGLVFKRDDVCFHIDNSCASCPNGDVIQPTEFVPDGCQDFDCFECYKCGNCCFSSTSKVRLKWNGTRGSSYLPCLCPDFVLGSVGNGLTLSLVSSNGFQTRWALIPCRAPTGSPEVVCEEVSYQRSFLFAEAINWCNTSQWTVRIAWYESDTLTDPPACRQLDGFHIWVGGSAEGHCCNASGDGFVAPSPCDTGEGTPGSFSFTVEVIDNHCDLVDDTCEKSAADVCSQLP